MEGTPHGHSARLRRGRYSEPGRVYLITTTTEARREHFADLALGRLVVKALRAERHAETLCYVVMPDHLHWMMQLTGKQSLSRVVQRVKSQSARWVNAAIGGGGAIWQDGFHDRAVRREEDLVAVARYVVANPLRAGLVQSLRHYPLWDAVWL